MPIGKESVLSANKNVYFSGRSIDALNHIRDNHINLSGLICRLLEDWYKNEVVKPDDTNSKTLTAAEIAPTPTEKQVKKLKDAVEIDDYIESRKAGAKNDMLLGALKTRLLNELADKGYATVKE